MTFDWPWALLLLPLPLLLAASARLSRSPGAPHASPDGRRSAPLVRPPPALADALDGIARQRRCGVPVARILLWIAWFSLLAALARPTAPGDTVVQPVSGRALVLVIDLSGSMEREDFTLDGRTSDRLSVVKRVAADFLERRAGDRVGLVLFGKEAFVAAMPTFDLGALRATLDGAGIAMAGRSTAIGDALGLAIRALRDDPAGEKAIVLLSDGTNNSGSVEPESAAALAASLDVRVHTIALGSDAPTRGGLRTAVSADLDEDTLRAVSDTAGGRFFRARSREELGAVYTEIDRLERADVPAPPVVLRRDWRHLPLALALLALCGLAFHERRRHA